MITVKIGDLVLNVADDVELTITEDCVEIGYERDTPPAGPQMTLADLAASLGTPDTLRDAFDYVGCACGTRAVEPPAPMDPARAVRIRERIEQHVRDRLSVMFYDAVEHVFDAAQGIEPGVTFTFKFSMTTAELNGEEG